MGTSRSTAQLVGKIDRYANAIPKANRKAVTAATMRYKERALQNVEADTGGDRRMSNLGRLRLGAGFELSGDVDARALLRPRPIGAWALLDSGSIPHTITPGSRIRSRGRGRTRLANTRKRALKFGDQYAARVEHPGSSGKGTFRKVPTQAKQAAMRSFRRSHAASLVDVFR